MIKLYRQQNKVGRTTQLPNICVAPSTAKGIQVKGRRQGKEWERRRERRLPRLGRDVGVSTEGEEESLVRREGGAGL